jgi:2-polyprenyl-6-methoxyphenol hydroxylase-like FAD-dependent oxidoreductase
MDETPVLIVGGGPVGLALASELGWRGIACTLVEQSDGTIDTPKMNEVNIRSMEFCRRWGIADAVQTCPFPSDYPLDVVFVTHLAGCELGRIRRPSRMKEVSAPYSPMRLEVCSQMWFDPILRNFAHTFAHVRLRYLSRLDGFEEDGDGVCATIIDLDSGRQERIRARYLVGCDGANSMVRRSLGIGLHAQTLGHPVHFYFRAPNLLERCRREPGTFFITVDRHGAWANVRIIDPVNAMWRLMVLDAGPGVTSETIDREAYLRRALGFSLDVEWLGTSVWTRRSAVAERYSSGRVYLAGDAVHQLSPTGGLGMNTGIADAVDLGWKLAATLSGWGGDDLLSSYDAERRPIGMRNVRMAAEFHSQEQKHGSGMALIEEDSSAGAEARARIGHALVRDIGRTWNTPGLQIGYRYEDSPICMPDAGAPHPDLPNEFVPSTFPGSRAPHAWLGTGRSTLDLFGRGFVLLRLGTNAPDVGTIQSAAAARGVPLEIVTLGDPAVTTLYERPLVLARPDGHVAWRADAPPCDPVPLIEKVRGARAENYADIDQKSQQSGIATR